jgi:hypothetical protein
VAGYSLIKAMVEPVASYSLIKAMAEPVAGYSFYYVNHKSSHG